tara:strand:- start:197 stop:643 length:447 start_codon:yes stop_codon:yes gene_type:complete
MSFESEIEHFERIVAEQRKRIAEFGSMLISRTKEVDDWIFNHCDKSGTKQRDIIHGHKMRIAELEKTCKSRSDTIIEYSIKIAELEKERAVRDLEQQAKGLEDYVSKTMDNSYILHLDPEDIHHCILINLNATALRLLERAKALKEQE